MNRFCFLLLSACCMMVFSCGQKEKSSVVPANIIPKQKMARVISHIHLAQAEENLHSLPDSTKMKPIDFQKIFVKDTISKQQYEESLTFYIDHPQLFNEVYEEAVNELSKMSAGNSK